MAQSFRQAYAFNADLSSWNTASVTDMYELFSVMSYLGDLSAWDTTKVTNCGGFCTMCALPSGEVDGGEHHHNEADRCEFCQLHGGEIDYCEISELLLGWADTCGLCKPVGGEVDRCEYRHVDADHCGLCAFLGGEVDRSELERLLRRPTTAGPARFWEARSTAVCTSKARPTIPSKGSEVKHCEFLELLLGDADRCELRTLLCKYGRPLRVQSHQVQALRALRAVGRQSRPFQAPTRQIRPR